LHRREFLKNLCLMGAGLGISPLGCLYKRKTPPNKKMLILAIDGMDPHLTQRYMREGLLPHFARLAGSGGFLPITTSTPPQSPVAWSDFAVGGTPYVHGIYDFIHRDAASMAPYLSTSKVTGAQKTIALGRWELPISGGETQLLRQGKPFWDYLADKDIPTTISRIPGNFPCENSRVNMVSGMGTPDLRGGYGSFTFFTTAPEELPKNITGGRVEKIDMQDHVARTFLSGPENTLKADKSEVKVPFTVWRDRTNNVVRIVIQEKEFVLKQGDWTDWVDVSFPLIPHIQEVKGICRFFIKQIHPEFMMYVSPINIAPDDPVLPIFSSNSYGSDLVRNAGRFYTQGLPDDTKALSYGILNEDEYLSLAYYILGEQRRMLEFELDRFSRLKTGMLFFYISSVDQNTHMYWRAFDKAHPLYNEQLHQKHGRELKKLYIEMDGILGRVMGNFDISDPANTLIVMSDHGFAPFRRQVNLNSWLYENGFLSLTSPKGLESEGFFEYVDWTSTVAYNIGINSIYLNLANREPFGVFPKSQAPVMLKNLRKALLAFADPQNGENTVSDVWITPAEHFEKNPHAPDLIVGWNRGYRCSWESILGGFSPQIIRDNDDKWSGDHCIDPKWVPALLMCNRKLPQQRFTLHDITATILSQFEIPIPEQMIGRPIFL
jgi:predicted AlkP superfamily phosphohydrolase/phosphomutase